MEDDENDGDDEGEIGDEDDEEEGQIMEEDGEIKAEDESTKRSFGDGSPGELGGGSRSAKRRKL